MAEKATIYDIAHTAGVSPATVSRMIHQPDLVTESTREKVLKAFEAHHIAPEDLATKKKSAGAVHRVTGASQNILVMLPSIDNSFYHEIVEGISSFLKISYYHMIITTEAPQRQSMPAFLNYCSSLQTAGIITMHPMAEDVLRQLHAAYPIVQCSEYNPFYQNVPYVSIDDYSVSRMAVAHLIRMGCKKIGFFSSPFEFRYSQNRYRAYRSMLSSNHLEIRPEYVIQVSGFSYDRILSAAERYYQLPDPPDAVFAVSDEHAHALVKAGEMMGFRIPEDIKVFGFDNTMYSTLSTPTISTVNQPRRELGRESARILLELIKDPGAPQESLLLPAELEIRESTSGQSPSSTYRNR